MKSLMVLILLALGGCATCREHPVVCIATGVAVGAIAGYEIAHHTGGDYRDSIRADHGGPVGRPQ